MNISRLHIRKPRQVQLVVRPSTIGGRKEQIFCYALRVSTNGHAGVRRYQDELKYTPEEGRVQRIRSFNTMGRAPTRNLERSL